MTLNRPKILVTGGAGFIGSHTCSALWNAGYEPVIIDNFSNAQHWVLDRIRSLTFQGLRCYEVNACDEEAVRSVIRSEGLIHGIIHFAAFKSVNESVEHPEMYFENNLDSLQTMINLKEEFNIPSLVFSSSATVYGTPDRLPVTETSALQPALSPYGETKQLGEEMILNRLETGAIILRYFNPIGAHPSGLLGELPSGVPQNLVPFITQTAAGMREKLSVFGTDYDTPDGTCIRDYIHVVDLANAHVAALLRLTYARPVDIFNIGTGRGTSVQEAIDAFQEVNQIQLSVQYAARRPGDVSAIYADCAKAENLLNWTAEYSIRDAMAHAWHWEKQLENLAEAA